MEQVSAAKLSALEDILDGAMAEGKKLVIIARFIPEIRAICKLLEKRGLGYSCITGEVKNRDEQVARFQKESEVMAFVGQIATAGLGITLTDQGPDTPGGPADALHLFISGSSWHRG